MKHGREARRGAGEPSPPEEWADLLGLGRAVEHEQVGEAPQVVSRQEDRHQQQVRGEELDRHVIAEVEHHDVAHDADRDQCAEQGGPADGQEQPADQLAQAGEDGVGHGRAHERPQQPHGRGVPEGLHQAVRRRCGELRWNDLPGRVLDDGHGEHEADVDPQPLVEPRVVAPLPVQEGPDQRGRDGDHQAAEDLDEGVGRVSAAIGGGAHAEDMLRDRGHERVPQPQVPRVDVGDVGKRERKAVQEPIHESEAEEQLFQRLPGRPRPHREPIPRPANRRRARAASPASSWAARPRPGSPGSWRRPAG